MFSHLSTDELIDSFMSFREVTLDELISNCCSARIWPDSDVCSSCKEHCSPVPPVDEPHWPEPKDMDETPDTEESDEDVSTPNL